MRQGLKYLAVAVLLSACADAGRAKQAAQAGDFAKASAAYETLAYLYDYPGAKLELAHLYQDHNGRGQYDEKIVRLLKESVAVPGGRAFYDLGRIYGDGSLASVPQDGPKAEWYYLQARKAGYWRADLNRARLYEKGKILPEDKTRAREIYMLMMYQRDDGRARDALEKMTLKSKQKSKRKPK